jgi:hypothetical protein
MTSLLTQCNADVYKAILDIKTSQPEIGEKLIAILQENREYYHITLSDILWFSAHLPWPIWDRKVHTFHLLFQSQPTTTMP